MPRIILDYPDSMNIKEAVDLLRRTVMVCSKKEYHHNGILQYYPLACVLGGSNYTLFARRKRKSEKEADSFIIQDNSVVRKELSNDA